MSYVVKYYKIIRSNWKKSTFAVVALSYAYGYTIEYFQVQNLMRAYCEKAALYGNQTIPVNANTKVVTIILNPNANKRKANDEFEKYCAPLLHLAGICVEVVKTEFEGHAKTLMENINNTDAIVVGGGDGTLSEVLTGLLRRTNEDTKSLVPIGILPLGQINSVAKNIFPKRDNLEKIRILVDATMAIVEETVKPLDVMRIEQIDNTEIINSNNNKPIYALSGIKWGAYRDAESKIDNYWVYGKFRKYATYLFNGYKNNLTWKCEAKIKFSPPCTGCSNCVTIRQLSNEKWYHRFAKLNNENIYSNIVNENCNELRQKNISTCDFILKSSNVIEHNTRPKLQLNIGPKKLGYFDFVKEGWKSQNEKNRIVEEVVEARTIEILPNLDSSDAEKEFSIDNESYDVKAIRVTLLPKAINVYCPK